MVQADPSRNYYADLGVQANCDESEIRKAFRQLALKFHPDRNPGREAEFVTKFQQIQAAHEVLSDKTQRAKYDNARRKFRPSVPSYSAPRPTPPARPTYTTTTPSGSYYRAPPPRPPPPQHHSTYTNGADRFTSKNFRAPPTAQRPSTRQQTEEKANVFTAWQKMKQPLGEEKRAKEQNPNNPNGAPFGRSKSTRNPSARREGFDPATPGGDEGQAKSSYRSSYNRPAPPPPANPFSNLGGESVRDNVPNVPYAEGNRVRTPYSSNAGERTSMFGEGVSRSASTRNSPRDSPTQRPKSQTEAGAYPGSGTNTPRNPHSAGSSKPFPHMYVSSSSDDDSEAEVFRGSRSKAAPKPSAKESANMKFRPGFSTSGPGLFGRPIATPKPFQSKSEESINMKFSPSDWHGKFEGKSDYFAPNARKGSSGKTSPTRGRASQRSSVQRDPFLSGSQPPPSVSSAVPPPAPMPPPPPGPPPQATASAPFNQSTYANPFQAPSFTIPQTVNPAVKFAKDEWAQTFQSANWAMPQPTKDTSPKRASNLTTKRTKANLRKPSVPPSNTPAGTSSEEPKTKYQAFAEDIGDADAMDIDDSGTSPVVEKPAPLGTQQPPAVETKNDQTYKPGMPLQFGSSSPLVAIPSLSPNPMSPTSSSSPRKNGTAEPFPSVSATAPPPAVPSAPASEPDLLDTLNSLRNVEPLKPTTDKGLSGISDLNDTLPFPSQPSSMHPTKSSKDDERDYPQVPTAPPAPSNINADTATEYLKRFQFYVREYLKFERTMLNHQLELQDQLDEKLANDFALNRGETTDKIGFSSYQKMVKEKAKFLETCAVARTMHEAHLQKAQAVRNRCQKMGWTLGGGDGAGSGIHSGFGKPRTPGWLEKVRENERKEAHRRGLRRKVKATLRVPG